jgi:hypothetical protein
LTGGGGASSVTFCFAFFVALKINIKQVRKTANEERCKERLRVRGEINLNKRVASFKSS